jgi:hypothetical protein
MPEEDFGAYLEDIRAVAKSPKDEDKDPETKFDGTRETAGDDGTEQSAIATFFSSALQTADL